MCVCVWLIHFLFIASEEFSFIHTCIFIILQSAIVKEGHTKLRHLEAMMKNSNKAYLYLLDENNWI